MKENCGAKSQPMPKKILKIAGFLLYLLLLVIIIDLIYTSFFERLPPLRNAVYLQMYGESIHRRSGIDGLFYELRPNSSLESININSLGMRCREVKKQKSCYRILVMGDSVTFALEMLADERFTEIAEKILNEKGKNVEILNAGVCCYNTNQELIALREKFLLLKPDLVIFAYCENDLADSAVQFQSDEYPQKVILKQGRKPKNFHYVNLNDKEYLALVLPNQFRLKEGINRWFLLNSGIYRFVSIRVFQHKRHIKDLRDLQSNLAGFDMNATLRGINKLALKNEFKVRFLLLPAPKALNWDKRKAIEYLKKNKIIFWDFDAVIDERFGKKAGICDSDDNSHLTVAGNRIIGELLAQELNKVIDGSS